MTLPLFPEGAAPLGSIGRAANRSTDSKRGSRSPSAPVRRDAPETSHEAARRIEGITGPLCQKVLAFIRERGSLGATDAETQQALEMLTQTETARRNALAKVGAVVDSGVRRLTPSGRRAIVWVAPEHAPGLEGGGK